MANVELMKAVLDKIHQDEEHWRQNSWRTQTDGKSSEWEEIDGKKVLVVNCKTAFCFAGWACMMDPTDRPMWAGTETLWANERDLVDSVDGGRVDCEDRAARLLDLDYEEAQDLFEGSNTLHRVEALVERFIEESVDA